LVSWELEKSLSTSLYFVVFFGVFLLFAAYEFWFVFFMERRCLAHELVMELGSQDYLLVPKIIFYCEDEAKRLAMRLVVEEDKYLKVEKAKHS
jgi:hypothetical protein